MLPSLGRLGMLPNRLGMLPSLIKVFSLSISIIPILLSRTKTRKDIWKINMKKKKKKIDCADEEWYYAEQKTSTCSVYINLIFIFFISLNWINILNEKVEISCCNMYNCAKPIRWSCFIRGLNIVFQNGGCIT